MFAQEGAAMPTHIEQELGLAPTTHRFRRWFRKLVSEEERSLDPLTVNYEAWRSVRHGVRQWPHYQEAPNYVEVLVSPEDWDDYWGIDSGRKESGVAAYVRARAAEKGYWMAGEPQVSVMANDAIEPGELEVSCQFIEPKKGEAPSPLTSDAVSSTGRMNFEELNIPPFLQPAPQETTRMTSDDMQAARAAARAAMRAEEAVPESEPEPAPEEKDPPTLRFIDEAHAGVAYLVGEGAFRLELHSGDCIGAVRWGEEVPPEVNVRLDAEGFPYVDVMQCTLAVLDGRWTVTNHAPRGTRLTKHDGRRFMLGEPEPCPIEEGDVLWLGPRRPLRFEMGKSA